jgi:hypothetical protein
MQTQRRRERTNVDIAVTVTTVLDSLPATITDLNEFGAKIEGAGLPEGTRFQIDVDGHDVFGIVRWTEVDRMGVYFPFGIEGSPLANALDMARVVRTASPARNGMGVGAGIGGSRSGAGMGNPGIGRPALSAGATPRGFGRRSG